MSRLFWLLLTLLNTAFFAVDIRDGNFVAAFLAGSGAFMCAWLMTEKRSVRQ